VDFAELWAQYGPAVALIAVLVVPFAGKLWDYILKLLETRQVHLAHRDQAKLKTEQEWSQHWVLELKDLIKDYRDQRDVALRQAEQAKAERGELYQVLQQRTDYMMEQYIEIVKQRERQDAILIEALRDVSETLRSLVDRIERWEAQNKRTHDEHY
jgi:hypothetical protein